MDMTNRDEVAALYRRVFSTTDGKLMSHDLARELGYLTRSTHVPGDSHQTAFNEGRRDAYVYMSRMAAELQEAPPGGVER